MFGPCASGMLWKVAQLSAFMHRMKQIIEPMLNVNLGIQVAKPSLWGKSALSRLGMFDAIGPVETPSWQCTASFRVT